MKTDVKSKWLLIVSLLLGMWQLNAQSFYNTFDRAQSIGYGVIEVSGNFAQQTYSFSGENETMSKTYGLRGGYGFSNNFDLKASWTLQRGKHGGDYHFFMIKPKFSFGESGIVAVALPFGLETYEFEEETFYVSPEILFNYPINNFIEIGTNARFVLPLDEDDELVGVSVAIGISPDLEQWVIRPEFGMLFDLGDDGYYFSPGVAFSYFFGGIFY